MAAPGLGRIQDDLWIVARKMAAVAIVLVVPLMVLTFPQSPYGLGPLGEAWWLTLLTTVLGVALFTEATVALVSMGGLETPGSCAQVLSVLPDM